MLAMRWQSRSTLAVMLTGISSTFPEFRKRGSMCLLKDGMKSGMQKFFVGKRCLSRDRVSFTIRPATLELSTEAIGDKNSTTIEAE
jgi:hypothetical protein